MTEPHISRKLHRILLGSLVLFLGPSSPSWEPDPTRKVPMILGRVSSIPRFRPVYEHIHA